MQSRRRRGWILLVIFGMLALLNLATRDYLGATGWALITTSLWLRDGAGTRLQPRWRVLLGNVALGGAVVILVILAVRLLRRVLA